MNKRMRKKRAEQQAWCWLSRMLGGKTSCVESYTITLYADEAATQKISEYDIPRFKPCDREAAG